MSLFSRMVPVLVVTSFLAGAAAAAERPVYPCYRLESPPKVDGDLSDWPAAIPVLFLGQENQVGSGEWHGPQDTSAMIRIAWDNQAVYFAIEVFDDQIVQNLPASQAGSIYTQDSVQMAIDLKPTLDRAGQGYDGNCYEYGFGKIASGPVVYRWHVSSSGLVPGVTDQVRLAVVPMKDGKGIIYEAAVPFEQLIPLRPGSGEIGFNIVIQDQDGDTHKNLQWTGGVTAGKDPSKFGRLKLVDAVASAKSALFISSQETVTAEPVPIRVYATAFGAGATAEYVLKSAGGETLRHGQMARIDVAGKTAFESQIEAAALPAGSYSWEVTVADAASGQRQTSRWQFQRIDYAPLQDKLVALQHELDAQIQSAQSHDISPDYALGVKKVAELFRTYTKEDIQNGQHALVKRNLQALCQAMRQAADNLKNQVETDSARKFWSVPKPDMSRLTIRNGSFTVDDQPVMLVGTMAWLWQIHAGVGDLSAFGFNTCRVDMAQRNFYDAQGVKTNDIPWWALIHCAVTAHRDNMAISDFLGVWDSWEIARRSKSAKLADIRTLYTKWLDQVFVWLKPGRFFDHTISVEGWRPAIAEFALAERAKLYQDWLAQEYGSIEKYNAVCGTNLASFAEAALPPATETQPARRYDRGRFLQEQIARELLWARNEIKKRDPRALVSGYGTLLDWDDENDFGRAGYDPEQDLKAYDIADFDTCGDFADEHYALSTIYWSAMFRDMVGSLAPGKPLFDNEFHFANLRKPYPPGFVPAIYWQAYIHGVSGTRAWVWHRSPQVDSALLMDAGIALELSHTALDIRRLSREIAVFHQQPPEIYVLRSMASSPFGAHLEQMRTLYEGLFFSGRKIGFMTEDQAAQGISPSVAMLIVPAVSHTSPEAAQAVAEFARRGGKVVLVGSCFTHDRRNVSRKTAIAGPNVSVLQSFSNIAAARKQLLPLLPQASAVAVNAPAGTTGRPTVEWRAAWDQQHRQWLLYLLNIGYGAVPVEIQCNGQPAAGVDALTGESIASGHMLQSLELRVLRINAAQDAP